MSALALDPVSAALYTRLNVSAVTSLATGGVSDDPAQGVTFPFVWFEVREEEARGFGTSGLPLVHIRVHVFSRYGDSTTVGAPQQAQLVMQQVITRLKDHALSVSGYATCGHMFYDETVTLSDEVLNGITVCELVATFRLFLEEA